MITKKQKKKLCKWLFKHSRGHLAFKFFPAEAKEAMFERVDDALKVQVDEWNQKYMGEHYGKKP